MTLIMTIENETSLPNGAPVSVRITDKRNLDIGRGAHLDWTLPDPSRFISGKHCEVRYRDGAYWIYDVSTNGTFLNDNTRRIQTPHRLQDGDRLAIGSYIIAVQVEDDQSKPEAEEALAAKPEALVPRIPEEPGLLSAASPLTPEPARHEAAPLEIFEPIHTGIETFSASELLRNPDLLQSSDLAGIVPRLNESLDEPSEYDERSDHHVPENQRAAPGEQDYGRADEALHPFMPERGSEHPRQDELPGDHCPSEAPLRPHADLTPWPRDEDAISLEYTAYLAQAALAAQEFESSQPEKTALTAPEKPAGQLSGSAAHDTPIPNEAAQPRDVQAERAYRGDVWQENLWHESAGHEHGGDPHEPPRREPIAVEPDRPAAALAAAFTPASLPRVSNAPVHFGKPSRETPEPDHPAASELSVASPAEPLHEPARLKEPAREPLRAALREPAPEPELHPAPVSNAAPHLPKATPPPAPAPHPQTATGKTEATLEEFIQHFAAAAGIPTQIFERQDKLKTADDLGYLMLLVVSSLKQLLSARDSAKRFARTSNRTVVQAFDNNPLKFAPTAEDALKIMLGPKTSGYLDARHTLEGAFDDLKAHQIKTFSAMQNAVKMLVEDLDPGQIDAALGPDNGLMSFLNSRKARLWDLYLARWQAKTLRHEDGLADAFMLYFSECYDRPSE